MTRFALPWRNDTKHRPRLGVCSNVLLRLLVVVWDCCYHRFCNFFVVVVSTACARFVRAYSECRGQGASGGGSGRGGCRGGSCHGSVPRRFETAGTCVQCVAWRFPWFVRLYSRTPMKRAECMLSSAILYCARHLYRFAVNSGKENLPDESVLGAIWTT